jgi:hypothetical protein
MHIGRGVPRDKTIELLRLAVGKHWR